MTNFTTLAYALKTEQIEEIKKGNPALWIRAEAFTKDFEGATDRHTVALIGWLKNEVNTLQTALFLAVGELSTKHPHTNKSPMDLYSEIVADACNELARDAQKKREASEQAINQ